MDQIKAHRLRIGAKTGRTGPTGKGQVPRNKGLKRCEWRIKNLGGKKMFHILPDQLDERINRDGHIEIKVEGH